MGVGLPSLAEWEEVIEESGRRLVQRHTIETPATSAIVELEQPLRLHNSVFRVPETVPDPGAPGMARPRGTGGAWAERTGGG